LSDLTVSFCRFQFLKGAIKRIYDSAAAVTGNMFQFLKGAIKSEGLRITNDLACHVSIP